MKTRHLWLALMGLVVMLAVWLCADGAKRQFPPEQVSPMAVVRRGGLVFSYRGPGSDKRAWLRPISSMPGVKVVQVRGDEPKVGEAMTCESSEHVVGRLRESETQVIETLLTCRGDDGSEKKFRVIGLVL